MGTTVSWYAPDDLPAIEALHRRSQRTLPLPYSWKENLASRDLCVVARDRERVVGAICVPPGESPVTWVSWAALSNWVDLVEWLELSLDPIFETLRSRGVRELVWLDHTGWAARSLGRIGFELLDEIITLTKSDRSVPCMGAADAHIRPARPSDLAALLAIDRTAFSPHWWVSEANLRHWTSSSAYFSVAQQGNELLGYATGETANLTSHLNRIAVHPDHQHRGVGRLLLRDGLLAFWREGARQITLNTQADNRQALRLYRHFQFEPEDGIVSSFHFRLQGKGNSEFDISSSQFTED